MMIYTENIFICLAAPLLIAVFLLKGDTRRFFGFFLLGLVACLLSGYINSHIAAVVADNGHAALTAAQSLVQLTPVCEEVMKALPVFFFAAILNPKREDVIAVAFAVGLGFATFENCCYIRYSQIQARKDWQGRGEVIPPARKGSSRIWDLRKREVAAYTFIYILR